MEDEHNYSFPAVTPIPPLATTPPQVGGNGDAGAEKKVSPYVWKDDAVNFLMDRWSGEEPFS